NDAKVKISKFVLKSLSSVRMERFLSLSSVVCLGESLSASDVLRANAPTFAGRVFTSSLKYTFPFVVTNEQYIAWVRSFLGLPPASTIGNESEVEGFDYP